MPDVKVPGHKCALVAHRSRLTSPSVDVHGSDCTCLCMVSVPHSIIVRSHEGKLGIYLFKGRDMVEALFTAFKTIRVLPLPSLAVEISMAFTPMYYNAFELPWHSSHIT